MVSAVLLLVVRYLVLKFVVSYFSPGGIQHWDDLFPIFKHTKFKHLKALIMKLLAESSMLNIHSVIISVVVW